MCNTKSNREQIKQIIFESVEKKRVLKKLIVATFNLHNAQRFEINSRDMSIL